TQAQRHRIDACVVVSAHATCTIRIVVADSRRSITEGFMSRISIRGCVVAACLAILGLSPRLTAQNPNGDFGVYVAAQLSAQAQQLFGFTHPLDQSAPGPDAGPDSTQA